MVSALHGGVREAHQQWIVSWRRVGRPVVCIDSFEEGRVAAQWVGCLLDLPYLLPLCIAFVAQLKGDDLEQMASALADKTEMELGLFLDRVTAGKLDEIERQVCKTILRHGVGPQKSEHLLSEVLRLTGDLETCVKIFGRLMPSEKLPAVLLLPQSGRTEVAAADVQALCRFAEVVPHLPVAVTLGEMQVAALAACEIATRWEVLLREGLVAVASAAGQRGSSCTAAEGATWRENGLRRALEFVAREGGELSSSELAQLQILAKQAVAEPEKGESAREGDEARSAAESFLFEVLERLPKTRGKFRLNQRLAVTFGNQRAEVDLLAVDAGLAIEIDGYHHFADADAYRRDRRKDVLLQKHDFFVLRFLAADVVTRLEDILDAIVSVIRYRSPREPHES
ncbi:endonuclease domain-containing protein [Verrucomicrobium spinosum]|uniref:endonuclease domain-containing protein n=1 Tax=Verrucomicrobium spinosum TaxID=2736 RepID=UPI0012F666E7|nr:DUF559 domain-containing protein [Verrucomicrobium spinosum]